MPTKTPGTATISFSLLTTSEANPGPNLDVMTISELANRKLTAQDVIVVRCWRGTHVVEI